MSTYNRPYLEIPEIVTSPCVPHLGTQFEARRNLDIVICDNEGSEPQSDQGKISSFSCGQTSWQGLKHNSAWSQGIISGSISKMLLNESMSSSLQRGSTSTDLLCKKQPASQGCSTRFSSSDSRIVCLRGGDTGFVSTAN